MENFTVSEISDMIKNALVVKFKGRTVTVTGEISNVKTSGKHIYLSLKDNNSIISVVFFGRTQFDNENGDHVEIEGKINYFERSGYVNLIGSSIKSIGLGALHTEYEKLKEEYDKKGYFNNKRDPPKTIKRIGVVTAKSGAALHDFIYALKEKGFSGDVYVYDCIVQGPRCPMSVAAGIKYFNSPFFPPKSFTSSYVNSDIDSDLDSDKNEESEEDTDTQDNSSDEVFDIDSGKAVKKGKSKTKIDKTYNTSEEAIDVDLIVITRGGGSFEDLMGFSHPKVVEAIFNSKKYTVSAVGHEVDSMLSDFVANHREPTPTYAGDFICRLGDTNKKQLIEIEKKVTRVRHELLQILYRYKSVLKNIDSTLYEPLSIIDKKYKAILSKARHDILQTLSKYKSILKNIERSIEDPFNIIEDKYRITFKKALIHVTQSLNIYRDRIVTIKEAIGTNDVNRLLESGLIAITNDAGDFITDIDEVFNKPVSIVHSTGKYKVLIQKIEPVVDNNRENIVDTIDIPKNKRKRQKY